MTEVERLLTDFIAQFRSEGDADPLPYLRKVAGVDRAELAALIDGFLAAAPPRAFDEAEFEAFRGSPERAALVGRLLTPHEALIDLRRGAHLDKAEVSRRLAERFGLSGRLSSVKACYHEIETGQVAPRRVREDVWKALGELFGETRERIREAASVAFEERDSAVGAFTRPALGPPSAAERRSESVAGPPGPDPVRAVFFSDED